MAPLPKTPVSPAARSFPADTVFPLPACGQSLANTAAAVATHTQSPPELIAHHLLTLAALAAQRLISVALPTGQQRPVSCYFLTLTGPGEGRSECERAVVAPIRAWEQQPPPLDRLGLFYDPPKPRTDDRYRMVRRQAAVFAGRSATWLAPTRTRFAEAVSLCGLWDGRVENVVPSGPYYPRLSVDLVTTPRDGFDFLRSPEVIETGLLGRCLAVAPASRVGERVWAPAPAAPSPAFSAFEARALELYKMKPSTHTRAIGFTASASAAWFAFAQEIEASMRTGEALAAIRPLAGRLPEHAARLAAVTALFENPALTELNEVDLARGITLARFYADEALRIQTLAPAQTSDRADQLQAWLARSYEGQDVTLRDVCRSGPPAVRDADTAYAVMRRLEKLGVVSPKNITHQGPGRPRRMREPYCWQVTTANLSREVA